MSLVIHVGYLLSIAAALITSAAALFAVIALFGAVIGMIEKGASK